MLSIKDLVFKERPARKLVDQYVGPYNIDEVVSTNVVKLQLLTSIRIHLVVNVSQASRRAKGRRSKTSRSRRSRRMKSRENLEQKKNKRSCQVFGIVEGVYSRA